MTLFDRLPIVRPSPALLAVDIAIFCLFCALGTVWMTIVASRTDNRVALVAHGVFTGYLVVLGCVVFLPLHGIREAAQSFHGTEPLTRAWYWGFQVENPIVDGHIRFERLANVVMTIPLGFGFGLLAPRIGLRRIFAACIAWAVSLELIQLGISVLVGFVYRTFDIDDVIDNTLGAGIGLAGFVACAQLVRSTGFGRDAPVTTVRGFIANSAERYVIAYRQRRGGDPGGPG